MVAKDAVLSADLHPVHHHAPRALDAGMKEQRRLAKSVSRSEGITHPR
jgi:hypothetical protein